MNLWCCECCAYVDSMLVGGDVVYPHRPDLYGKKFYQCPNCKNSVGTHQQWGKSFVKGRDYNIRAYGCIPNAKLNAYFGTDKWVVKRLQTIFYLEDCDDK